MDTSKEYIMHTTKEKDDVNWVAAWSTSPVDASTQGKGKLDSYGLPLSNITSRIALDPTMSGSAIRIKFSNEYGTAPLKIEACTVARTEKNNRAIDIQTLEYVTFCGSKSFVVPKGDIIVSDAIPFQVIAGQKISVSTFYKGFNFFKTVGLIGAHSYAHKLNHVTTPVIHGPELNYIADSGNYDLIPTITEIDVAAEDDAYACVVYGDSTVDNEVPRYFADRLRSKGIKNVSITQAALKGNRLIADAVGIAGKLLGSASTKRFKKDVLSQAGVKSVIVKIGANDVVHPHCESMKGKLTPATLEQMIAGYKQLIDICHENDIKIYMCEIAPWKGYTRSLLKTNGDVFWSEEIDQLRLDINKWMASDDCDADAFIPLPDLADPTDPYSLLSSYTTDGAHCTEAGAMAIAREIPISLFK